MIPSLLTTILFSLSVIFAAESAKLLGASMANLARITLATGLLAIWAHGFGPGLSGPALPWFFLSGVIGFGLGDMALFGALPRIGPRLTILLTQCLAAPIAAFAEWLWLGTTLRSAELGCVTLILGGVALALAPDRGWESTPRAFWLGVAFGVGAAFGQALGAVLSRKANAVATNAGFAIDGGSAAYQRIIGGLLITALAFFFIRKLRREPSTHPVEDRRRRAWSLVVANALAGPSLGVGCYQWALKTTPSGVVLPIVATAPLVTMLFTFFMTGLRPSRRAIVGGMVAVIGVVLLQLAQIAPR